jgi:hypothetical protein
VQRDVRIDFRIQVVVVQAVDDAVGAHRQPRQRAQHAAEEVGHAAMAEQPIVRGVVREHEHRVLLRGDDDDGREHDPPRPHARGEPDGDAGDRKGLRDGERRTGVVEGGEPGEKLGRQQPRRGTPVVVAELLAGAGERAHRHRPRGAPSTPEWSRASSESGSRRGMFPPLSRCLVNARAATVSTLRRSGPGPGRR